MGSAPYLLMVLQVFLVSEGVMGLEDAGNWQGVQLFGSARKWSSAQPVGGAQGCGNLAARGVLRHSFTLEEMRVLGRG